MQKSSKEERKKNKKHIKAQHTFLKHEGLCLSKKTTNFMVVSNGGLDNGVKREEILKLFGQSGKVIDVVMKSSKPYSFVTMESLESAKLACECFHGRQVKCPEEFAVPGITLYISYIDFVPGIEIPDTTEKNLPPGLTVIENFISITTEKYLMECIEWGKKDKQSSGEQENLKHRQVKHYGYEFMYGVNNIDINRPLEYGIPVQCKDIMDKMVENGFIKTQPDQLTINQYLPGQGIPPHVDTHSAFEDTIMSLSLGSQVIMDFRNPAGKHLPVLLPQRSLLIMKGQCRYHWTHGITPRKSDIVLSLQLAKRDEYDTKSITSEQEEIERNSTDSKKSSSAVEKCQASDFNVQNSATSSAVGNVKSENKDRLTLLRRNVRTSFTFRKVRGKPCTCAFPEQCDSQQNIVNSNTNLKETNLPSKTAVPSTDKEAQKLEEELVHNVYEEIAGHFSDTRHSPWPKVVEFLEAQPPGSVILDVGCGNGKYLSGTDWYKIGCDRSSNLCEICDKRGFPVLVCDCLSVPFRSNSVDVVISIAVIHHLSTEERRHSAIEEIVKVLRPGGEALIYVWALEQELNKEKSNYLKPSKMENVASKPDCENLAERSTNEFSVKGINTDSTEGSISNIPNATYTVKELTAVENISENSNSEEKDIVKYLPVHVNRTPFVSQDTLVPWHLRISQNKQSSIQSHEVKNTSICSECSDNKDKSKEAVYHRYYHVFKQGELEKLCLRITGVTIKKGYYDKGNWCVIFSKN